MDPVRGQGRPIARRQGVVPEKFEPFAVAAAGGGEVARSYSAAWELLSTVTQSLSPVWEIAEPAAERLWATNFESGLTITSQGASTGNTDQYLEGGDIAPWLADPPNLWNTPSFWQWYILAVTGNGLPSPTTDYIENTIADKTGADGATTRALWLNIKQGSPNTGVEQTNLQTVGSAEEAVYYQRHWIKFDAATLTRAIAATSTHFYQIFYELKANPDFRIRCELRFNGTNLYWYTQGDILTDANPLWSASLTTVPVVLAAHDSPLGWHKFEVWIDRPAGRYKVAIDGVTLIDRTGNLYGTSGNIIDENKHFMVYGIHAGGVNANVLFDRLEIYDKPPADAWSSAPHTTGANVAPALSTYDTSGTVNGNGTITLTNLQYAFTSNFATSGTGLWEIRYEGTGSIYTRENTSDYDGPATLPITKYKTSANIERVQALANGTATLTAITVRPVTWD